MKHVFILMITAYFFTSCDPQDAELKFKSPDGHAEVRISGKRSFKLDPWQLSIGVTAFERKEMSLTVDMNIDEISKEFISWDWQSPEICLITFIRPDDTKRYFKVTANKDISHLVEVYQ